MTSSNRRELIKLEGVIHELTYNGFTDVWATSNLSSYQVKEVLDAVCVSYESEVMSLGNDKFIRITIK